MPKSAAVFHRQTRPAVVPKLVAVARIGDVEKPAIQHMHLTATVEIQIRIPLCDRPRIIQPRIQIRLVIRDLDRPGIREHSTRERRIPSPRKKSRRKIQRHIRPRRQRAGGKAHRASTSAAQRAIQRMRRPIQQERRARRNRKTRIRQNAAAIHLEHARRNIHEPPRHIHRHAARKKTTRSAVPQNAPTFHRHSRPTVIPKLVASTRIRHIEKPAAQHMHFPAPVEIQIRIPLRDRPRIQQRACEIRLPPSNQEHALIPHRPPPASHRRRSNSSPSTSPASLPSAWHCSHPNAKSSSSVPHSGSHPSFAAHHRRSHLASSPQRLHYQSAPTSRLRD